MPAWGKGAPDAGTDIDGLQFVRNDQEVAAMVRTFEMIGRARERADAVGAEAASREFQIPQLALSVKDLPLTGPVAHPPFGTALAVTPAGSWKNDRWTGLARYFRMGDGTWIELSERDLAASRGMLYLTPAMVNVDINGKPASAMAFVDGSGRRLRRVIWVRGPRLYELTVLDPQSGIRVLPPLPRFLLPVSGRPISHVPRVTGRCRPAGYRAASELISTFFVLYSLTAASGLAAEPSCGTGGCTTRRAGRRRGVATSFGIHVTDGLDRVQPGPYQR